MWLGLYFGEFKRVCHQRVAGRAAVLAGADGGDDLVDQVEGPDQAFNDVQAFLGCIKTRLRTPGDDLDLMVNVGDECTSQIEGAGHPGDQRNHVDAETGLQWCAFPEVVEHDFRVGVAFE